MLCCCAFKIHRKQNYNNIFKQKKIQKKMEKEINYTSAESTKKIAYKYLH